MAIKLARDLVEGDMIDLEDDEYATFIDRVDATSEDIEAYELTISTFAYEYAVVDDIEVETPWCVLVHTSLTSFGCPPDHEFEMMPNFQSSLVEQNARMRELDLEED
jgi:hypothetical protein